MSVYCVPSLVKYSLPSFAASKLWNTESDRPLTFLCTGGLDALTDLLDSLSATMGKGEGLNAAH